MDCKQCMLSDVTKDYLCTYNEILDNMIDGMKCVEMTDSISHNFIAQMLPHHRAAIKMSENILKYTTNLAVQKIARCIIEEQEESIEALESIECFCSEKENTRADLCLYERKNEQILNNMFACMKNACYTNSVNCNFLREMIPHHRGAVEMSENALCYCTCCELVPVLKSIIANQKRGINQMTQLLNNMC